MGIYRPLRGILFIYELVRLVVLVWAIEWGTPAGEGLAFPAPVFGAANALFLLMALFVWRDPVRFGVYVPLYTAGKVISVVSALGWCVFSLERIFNAFFMDKAGFWIVLGSLFCVALGDILSVCGAFVLLRKLKRIELLPTAPPSAGEYPDDLQKYPL